MDKMDPIFKALADGSRRTLLDQLFLRNGQTLNELCEHLDTTRQSITKHLRLLEDAGLIVVEWQGRHKRHYLNAAPIADIYDRWIRKYDRLRVEALQDLKNAWEADHEPE